MCEQADSLFYNVDFAHFAEFPFFLSVLAAGLAAGDFSRCETVRAAAVYVREIRGQCHGGGITARWSSNTLRATVGG